jgi:hypothetical protein
MTRSKIWVGIGAFVLVTMGTVNVGPSNGDTALSSLSVGGAPALAQPSILDTLEDLGLGPDIDEDDGYEPADDDDGPDADDDDDDDAPAAGKKKKR